MSSKFNRFFGILAILAILTAKAALGFAESDFEDVKLTIIDGDTLKDDITAEIPESDKPDKSDETDESKKSSTAIDQEAFLTRLKQELNLSKTDYKQVLNSITETKKRLEFLTEERHTLQEQLGNLDAQINNTTRKLIAVIKQVIEKENEIALLYEQIEIREVALEYQKELLKDYIRLIYQEEDNLLSIEKDGSINAFKLLLTEETIGDNLRRWEYFSLLNETGQQLVEKLETISKQLQEQKKLLEEKKLKLEELKIQLTKEKEQLELQKESKKQLLKITLGQEEVYKQLLEQTVKEQEQLVSDIKSLSNALSFIEAKILEDGDNFDIEKYKDLLDPKAKLVFDFQLDSLGLETDEFVWPVEPNRGISAYFRDPRYVGVFGVQHNAVDIPAYQGSTVRAAADGIVYMARDNGYGYSYIILAHAGNVMTVYGHISNILVESGQVVAKGSIIGLSGGMPGSKGAGYMTTGPHLHFETLMDGKWVDPFNYLPMENLSKENIDKLPEKYQQKWQDRIIYLGRKRLERYEEEEVK